MSDSVVEDSYWHTYFCQSMTGLFRESGVPQLGDAGKEICSSEGIDIIQHRCHPGLGGRGVRSSGALNILKYGFHSLVQLWSHTDHHA